MLFNLLMANKAIFLCLFLFLPIFFRNILTISFLSRNTRLILPLNIPKGVTMIVNGKRETSRFTPDKKSSFVRKIEYCDIPFKGLANLFSVISAMKKSISLILQSLDYRDLYKIGENKFVKFMQALH